MKTLRRTAQWMLILALLGSAAGGGYAYHLWQQSDKLLRDAVMSKIKEVAPEWIVELGRARFDFQGRIRLYDIKLRTAPGNEPLVDIPEVVLTMDREQLTEPNPTVKHVRLVRPVFQLARNRAGGWNWKDLPPRQRLGGPIAEWQVENALITVTIDDGLHAEPTTLVLRDADALLLPSGKREFLVRGNGKIDLADALTIEAHWNLDNDTWDCGGELKDLKVNAAVLDLISDFSPEFRQFLQRAPGVGPQSPNEPLVAEQISEHEESRFSSMSINAVIGARFYLAQWEPEAELEYKVGIDLQTGEFTHAALPFALYDLRGGVDVDNRQIIVRRLTARNGATQFGAEGRIVCSGDQRPADFTVTFQDLSLEDRARCCPTDECRQIHDLLQPAGKIDGRVRLLSDGQGHWTRESDLVVKSGSFAVRKFPYHVDHVHGTVQQRKDTVQLNLKGVAGQRPVVVTGKVKNPGPEAEALFDIQVAGLPLDEKFRGACSPPAQSVLDSLRVHGTVNLHVQLRRAAGPHHEFTPTVVAQVSNCTASPKCFSYTLSNLSGTVELKDDVWSFRDMQGVHESAQVTASGQFGHNAEGRKQLDLRLKAMGATFNPALQAALPEQWQTIWREFSPSGRLNASAAVLWVVGDKPRVRIDAELMDAGISMKSFAFPWEDVQARVSIGEGKLLIESLSARHEETRVRLHGEGEFAADGEWRVRLEDLLIDDLEPDRRFRKALPARLRDVIETLDPRGRLSASGMLEFRGTGHPADPVTAAWDLETIYSGNKITAGVDLENLHGRVGLRGRWDGESVVGSGRIDLDALSFRGVQLTQVQGPVSVNGTQLVIGSREVTGNLQSDGPVMTDSAKRLTARFIDGILALDGVAVLEGQTAYRVRMTLTGGRLERYAQLYLPGRNKLMGIMNGWLDLNGRGGSSQRLSGKGQLLISPAALYELPVIVAIFKILRAAAPDKTAFKNALVDFDVGGGQFHFKRIDLIGDAINLRGRGYVRFDGPVNLDFYSSVPRNHLSIPILQEVIGEMTKGWMSVEVRGTLSEPQANIRAVPQMDDALRRFLGIFDGRPNPNRAVGEKERPRGVRQK